MSRSFKNTIGNHSHWIRTKLCCVKNDSLKKWRTLCNRIMRRKNKQILGKLDIEDADGDDSEEKILDHYKKTQFGDDWGGPHDGYYYGEPESYKDYQK